VADDRGFVMGSIEQAPPFFPVNNRRRAMLPPSDS
jgi:hypothetical protein